MKYAAPEIDKEAFNCPYCQAYSHQLWHTGFKLRRFHNYVELQDLKIAYCSHCEKDSFWINGTLIYPETIGIPNPNEDLDDEIQRDYLEAASIINKSPRGAAALMRLAIQKLCKQLGESGDNINNDIANLVKNGLPLKVQQALDTVRVIGNESVHPGEINLNDDREIANKLFELVNIIANIMITQPKEIENLYNTLPEEKLEGIKNRDSPK